MIPMPGKIIVKQDGGSEKRGGVLVSQKFAEKDRPQTGRVLAVGPGKQIRFSLQEIHDRFRWEEATAASASKEVMRILAEERQSLPVCVKAGDRVVFKVFAGDGIEWTDGSMCRCVTEDDLLAVILE